MINEVVIGNLLLVQPILLVRIKEEVDLKGATMAAELVLDDADLRNDTGVVRMSMHST